MSAPTALGRFETLAPHLQLTSLKATIRSKPDITIRYVKVQINGDNRPGADIASANPPPKPPNIGASRAYLEGVTAAESCD